MAEAPAYGWNVSPVGPGPPVPTDQNVSAGDPNQSNEKGANADVMVYNNQQYPPSNQPPPYPLPPPEAPPPSYDSLFGRVKAAKQASSGIGGFFTKFFEIACSVFIGSIGFAVIYGLLLALPFAMVVIGALYVKDCPVERFIPIYLIVGGSSWLLWQFFVFKPCKKKKKKNKKKNDEGSTDGVAEGTGRNNAPVESVEHIEGTHIQLQVMDGPVPGSADGADGKQETTDTAEQQTSESKDEEKVSCMETTLVCFIIAWFIAGNVWVYRTTTLWQGEDPLDVYSYCHPLVYTFSFWLITGAYILFACVFTCVSVCGLCCG